MQDCTDGAFCKEPLVVGPDGKAFCQKCLLPAVQKMPDLEFTRAWMRSQFVAVKDKAGKPYIDHLLRVEALLPADATEDEHHAALLHDAIEDTGIDEGALRDAGYSKEVIYIVALLTHDREMPYWAYLNRICRSGNRSAIRVKLADNADNRDPKRCAQLSPEWDHLKGHYDMARRTLLDGLEKCETIRA